MRVWLNFLAALTLAIQEELHFIKIRMHPNANDLTFPLFPVPVRKQMQDGLTSPPSLVVEVVVLGKTTHVYDAELRVDRRPAVWRRLAAIIEASPSKATRQPFASRIEFPPLLCQL